MFSNSVRSSLRKKLKKATAAAALATTGGGKQGKQPSKKPSAAATVAKDVKSTRSPTRPCPICAHLDKSAESKLHWPNECPELKFVQEAVSDKHGEAFVSAHTTYLDTADAVVLAAMFKSEPGDVFLDNCSQARIFKDKWMLTSLHSTGQDISLSGIGGTVTTDVVGTFSISISSLR